MTDRLDGKSGNEDQQAQRLATLGLLAGGIAHDFNNRIAAIVLQVSLLHLKHPLDPDVWAALSRVEDEAMSAGQLTTLLSLFSRRSAIKMTTVNCNELVERLLKLVRRLVGEHHEVTWVPQPVLPLVQADAGMMEQLIVNLCVSACGAISGGGPVALATSTAVVSAADAQRHPGCLPGGYVCLTVSGTGTAIDGPLLDEMAARHGGWIEAGRDAGGGSTFRLFIPAAAVPMADGAREDAGPVIGGAETILLVEDEPSVRDAASAYLRELGYTVLAAEGAAAATALWRSHGPSIDLLFTDMILPGGLTGLALAEELRRESPRLKVMISSGYHDEMVKQGLSDRSDLLYVSKPCRGPDLAWAVRMCLDHPQQ